MNLWRKAEVGTAIEKIQSGDILFPSITVCAYKDPLTLYNPSQLVPLAGPPNVTDIILAMEMKYMLDG